MTAVEWIVKQLTPAISLQQKHIDELLKEALQMEEKQIADAIQFGYLDEGDFMGIEYFYETRFNDGKNICPNCKQGILRLDRPGKMGCSVC
jgi:hypothetical protein